VQRDQHGPVAFRSEVAPELVEERVGADQLRNRETLPCSECLTPRYNAGH